MTIGKYYDHLEERAERFKAYQSEWSTEPRQADLISDHTTWEEAALAASADTHGRTPFIGQESSGRWWKREGVGDWIEVTPKVVRQRIEEASLCRAARAFAAALNEGTTPSDPSERNA